MDEHFVQLGRAEVRQRLLHRHRMRVVDRLARLTGIKFLKLDYQPEEAPDPLVKFCTSHDVKCRHGRLGFYFEEAKVPGFAQFLRQPQKASSHLEELFQEACDTYEGLRTSAITIIPALVFEVNGIHYAYSAHGTVESESVMLVRWRNNLRFIYTLPRFLQALGTIEKLEEGE